MGARSTLGLAAGPRPGTGPRPPPGPRARTAAGVAGDTWTWTATDADTKLIVAYLVGGRDAEYAAEFMGDVVALVDAAAPVPVKRGLHRKRAAAPAEISN